LVEAKSINTSLASLGNVITALADARATHVPYRDSKLTRLLQDSLGGHASTVLIATVGPAAVNRSETLSILLFASRCMHVMSIPIVNEQMDFEELVASLRSQLATSDHRVMERETRLKAAYEEKLAALRANAESLWSQLAQQQHIVHTLREQLKVARQAGEGNDDSADVAAHDYSDDDGQLSQADRSTASARVVSSLSLDSMTRSLYLALCELYRMSSVAVLANFESDVKS
jgi:hypothetical protein